MMTICIILFATIIVMNVSLWKIRYQEKYTDWKRCHIKHLMTGSKGNTEFCFPKTLNVPQDKAEGNIEVEGKRNSLFPTGPVIKCFVIPRE